MQVLILAGGKGTRLQSVIGTELPKPLVDIGGRPLLDHQLTLVAAAGLTDVVLLTGHGASAIREFCGSGDRWGLSVRCVEEPVPRGSAGCVYDVLDDLAPRFMIVYGDTMLNVDLTRFMAAHEASGADATLFLHPNDHPHDSDLVEIDRAGRIQAFHGYPHPPSADLANLVNAALYIVDRAALQGLEAMPGKPDFGKHVFPAMLSAGRHLQGYVSTEYIKDAGTPERLAKVCRDLASGRVERQSLAHRAPTVFLDRDGVLNVEAGRISRPDQLVLLPGAAAAVSRVNQSDYRAVVLTNQAVVARGDCTEDELTRIHARLETLLGREGAYLDRLYYCPHIPDRGFPGERLEHKIICTCRKPSIGMFERAVGEMNLDPARSWMVGDSTSDIEMARAAGLYSILVRSGLGGRDGKFPTTPDFVFEDLAEAVEFILVGWPALLARAQSLLDGVADGALVLLGGPARVGKSTWASVMRLALARSGRRGVVISLDAWLRSAADREEGGGVLTRFDLPAAESWLLDLVRNRGTRSLPHYDRFKRVSHANADVVSAEPSDIIIVEGVPALLSPILISLAVRRLYVDCDSDARQSRLRRDFAYRGSDVTKAEFDSASREIDEVAIVEASRGAADDVLT